MFTPKNQNFKILERPSIVVEVYKRTRILAKINHLAQQYPNLASYTVSNTNISSLPPR